MKLADFFSNHGNPDIEIMIIDCHTHIFPNSIQANRQTHFANESEFESIYSHPKATIITAEELIAQMDESGVDKSVVFGFPWNQADTVQRHNDYILEAIARFPERLIGFCTFGLSSIDPIKEIERCVRNGMRGVGEIGFYHEDLTRENIEKLAPLMDFCLQHDLPVLLHVNEPIGHQYPGKAPISLLGIYELVSSYQKNTIILAHWGGGLFFYNLLKNEASQRLTNVYFDTAASPFLYKKEIYPIATQIVGDSNLLFGSDYPLIHQGRYLEEMRQSGISDDSFQKIAGINAEKLLKLKD